MTNRTNEPNLGSVPILVVLVNPATGATIPPLIGAPAGPAAKTNFGSVPMAVVVVDPATGLPVTFS